MLSTLNKSIIHTTRSELAEKLFTLDGAQFSLKDYPTHYQIYDCDAQEVLWICGRQVGKTTSACNRQVASSVIIPNHKSLYVSPSRKQTSKYSNTKIGKVIWQSEFIQKHMLTRQLSFSVFLKMFRNGSEMNFDYCIGEDADRVRGTAANELLVDEVQDMDWTTAGPILKSCLSGSTGGGKIAFYGTAKETENTIAWLFDHSSKHEWLVKCTGCNKWNKLGFDNIIFRNKDGIVCKKCSKILDVRKGMWVAMQPGKDRVGFHIPQIAVARNIEDKGLFRDIVDRNHPENIESGYPMHRYLNEVLGEPTDIGSRLVTREFIQNKVCNPDYARVRIPHKAWQNQFVAFGAGIDHSGGGLSGLSRSVLAIVGKTLDGRFRVIFDKIYSVCNPVHNVEDMADRLKNWGIRLAFADAGEGALANAILKEKVGPNKLFQVQYGYFRHPFKWNNEDRYLVDKTSVIDTFMHDLLQGKFEFPRVGDFHLEIEDILAEYETVTEGGIGRRIWTHSPEKPDDFLHALIFAWLAVKSLTSDLYFYRTSDDMEKAA